MNNSPSSSTLDITQQADLCGVKSPTNILNPIILLEQEKQRRAKLPKNGQAPRVISQARARSISSFNLSMKRFQLVSTEPLCKGPYKYLQSHQWRNSQVEIDTTELNLEDEVPMAMGTNSIVFNKYVKVVAELDKKKILV